MDERAPGGLAGFVGLLLFAVLASPWPAWAGGDGTPNYTSEQKAQADALDAEAAILAKQAAVVTAKNTLRSAQLAEAAPASGKEVTAPTGKVDGAKELGFAMYIASMDSLELIARQVCTDWQGRYDKVFVTTRNIPDAVARDISLSNYRDVLAKRLDKATLAAGRLTAQLGGTADARASAASLSAVSMGIDVASGLVQGVAGLAALFKSERKIEGVDNLVSANEANAMFSMCKSAPHIDDLDANVASLPDRLANIGLETSSIQQKIDGLESALEMVARAKADLDQTIASAPKKAVAALKQRVPAGLAEFQKKAGTLISAATQFVDAMYTVDAATGVSPMIVAAQNRAIHLAVGANMPPRMVLTLLRSSGDALTTHRLLLNDKVAYAGGVALRVALLQPDGSAAYERMYYRQSGWIRASFDDGGTLPLQNFGLPPLAQARQVTP